MDKNDGNFLELMGIGLGLSQNPFFQHAIEMAIKEENGKLQPKHQYDDYNMTCQEIKAKIDMLKPKKLKPFKKVNGLTERKYIELTRKV